MKKKHFILSLALLFLLSLMLFACGRKKNDYTAMTAKEFAKLLIEEDCFEASLSEIDPSLLQQLYGLDPELFSEKLVFANSGSSAEEILLLKIEDEEQMDEVVAILTQHLKNQEALLKDYLPNEVPKLQSAKVQVEAPYLALVVSQKNDLASEMTLDWLRSR